MCPPNSDAKAAPIDAAPKSTKLKPFLYASNCVGIPTGLLFTMAGFNKVSGGMDDMVLGVYPAFFGVPGVLMKYFFIFQVIGGVCLLGGMAVKSFAKLDDKKSDLLETLILMDGVGLTSFYLVGQFFHVMLDGALAIIVIAPIFFALRLAYNKGVPPAEFKMLFFGFLAFNVVGVLAAIGLHFAIGEMPEMPEA